MGINNVVESKNDNFEDKFNKAVKIISNIHENLNSININNSISEPEDKEKIGKNSKKNNKKIKNSNFRTCTMLRNFSKKYLKPNQILLTDHNINKNRIFINDGNNEKIDSPNKNENILNKDILIKNNFENNLQIIENKIEESNPSKNKILKLIKKGETSKEILNFNFEYIHKNYSKNQIEDLLGQNNLKKSSTKSLRSIFDRGDLNKFTELRKNFSSLQNLKNHDSSSSSSLSEFNSFYEKKMEKLDSQLKLNKQILIDLKNKNFNFQTSKNIIYEQLDNNENNLNFNLTTNNKKDFKKSSFKNNIEENFIYEKENNKNKISKLNLFSLNLRNEKELDYFKRENDKDMNSQGNKYAKNLIKKFNEKNPEEIIKSNQRNNKNEKFIEVQSIKSNKSNEQSFHSSEFDSSYESNLNSIKTPIKISENKKINSIKLEKNNSVNNSTEKNKIEKLLTNPLTKKLNSNLKLKNVNINNQAEMNMEEIENKPKIYSKTNSLFNNIDLIRNKNLIISKQKFVNGSSFITIPFNKNDKINKTPIQDKSENIDFHIDTQNEKYNLQNKGNFDKSDNKTEIHTNENNNTNKKKIPKDKIDSNKFLQLINNKNIMLTSPSNIAPKFNLTEKFFKNKNNNVLKSNQIYPLIKKDLIISKQRQVVQNTIGNSNERLDNSISIEYSQKSNDYFDSRNNSFSKTKHNDLKSMNKIQNQNYFTQTKNTYNKSFITKDNLKNKDHEDLYSNQISARSVHSTSSNFKDLKSSLMKSFDKISKSLQKCQFNYSKKIEKEEKLLKIKDKKDMLMKNPEFMNLNLDNNKKYYYPDLLKNPNLKTNNKKTYKIIKFTEICDTLGKLNDHCAFKNAGFIKEQIKNYDRKDSKTNFKKVFNGGEKILKISECDEMMKKINYNTNRSKKEFMEKFYNILK